MFEYASCTAIFKYTQIVEQCQVYDKKSKHIVKAELEIKYYKVQRSLQFAK